MGWKKKTIKKKNKTEYVINFNEEKKKRRTGVTYYTYQC